MGDAYKAIEFYEQYLSIAREIGDRRGEGNALGNLGMTFKNLGETDKARKLWLDALTIFKAIESPHIQTVQKWINELDGVREEQQSTGMTVQDFVRGAIQAARRHSPQAGKYFEAVTKMVRDPNLSPEIQELSKVLQKILTGIESPDLSRLTQELSILVKEELEK